MPPLSPCVKNSSSVTSFASVWWVMKTISHVVVLGAEEAHHPEVEAASDVFLELTHRARDIHHGDDDGVRLVADRRLPGLEAQVFRFVTFLRCGIALGRVALDVLENRAPLVEVGHVALLCGCR